MLVVKSWYSCLSKKFFFFRSLAKTPTLNPRAERFLVFTERFSAQCHEQITQRFWRGFHPMDNSFRAREKHARCKYSSRFELSRNSHRRLDVFELYHGTLETLCYFGPIMTPIALAYNRFYSYPCYWSRNQSTDQTNGRQTHGNMVRSCALKFFRTITWTGHEFHCQRERLALSQSGRLWKCCTFWHNFANASALKRIASTTILPAIPAYPCLGLAANV